MSFYALVMNGKVLGFRDNVDELSLQQAERTALVAWSDAPISIYEVEGRLPQEADRAMRDLEKWLIKNPSAEPVSVVKAEPAVEGGDVDAEDERDPLETTGCYVRTGGEPGSSGFFASVG